MDNIYSIDELNISGAEFLVLVEAKLDYPDPYAGQRGEAPAGSTCTLNYLKTLAFKNEKDLAAWISRTLHGEGSFYPSKTRFQVIRNKTVKFEFRTIVEIEND